MFERVKMNGTILVVLLSLAFAVLLTGCLGSANVSISPIFRGGVLTVAPIPEKSYVMPAGTVEIEPGYFSEVGETHTHEFFPTLGGTYRFEVSGMVSGSQVEMYVYNQLGKIISNPYSWNARAGNGEGITIDLVAGEQHKITVKQLSGPTGYDFLIGHKKPTEDVSPYTVVSDSIEYSGQRNTYSYIPEHTGMHRFEASGMPSNHRVSMYLYNQRGDIISNPHDWNARMGNGEGISRQLNAGEKYTLAVLHESDLCDFDLKIGPNKPVVDISGALIVSDSVQFASQENTYTFTPKANGQHQFEIKGLVSGAKVGMYLYNQGVQEIGRGNSISKGLIAGEKYTIKVVHSSGYSKYDLKIDAPRVLPF